MAPTIRNLLETLQGTVLIPGSPGTRSLKVDPSAPAVTAMTDFRTAPVVTTRFDTSIDDALAQMKRSGARFTFVTGADGSLVGSVTSYDIQGEKPVQYMVSVGCSETTCAWRDVQVENIMEPISNWLVLDHSRASRMSVAQVADLMAQGGQRYLVVVEAAGEPGGARQVRGLFSAARLQLLAGSVQASQPAEEALPA
jgi:CBS domain-containing protein